MQRIKKCMSKTDLIKFAIIAMTLMILFVYIPAGLTHGITVIEINHIQSYSKATLPVMDDIMLLLANKTDYRVLCNIECDVDSHCMVLSTLRFLPDNTEKLVNIPFNYNTNRVSVCSLALLYSCIEEVKIYIDLLSNTTQHKAVIAVNEFEQVFWGPYRKDILSMISKWLQDISEDCMNGINGVFIDSNWKTFIMTRMDRYMKLLGIRGERPSLYFVHGLQKNVNTKGMV